MVDKLGDRTLLVLGAGASIGAAMYPKESSLREAMSKMPSGDNFFYDLFHQPANDFHDERHLNTLGLTYEGLNWLIVRAWALDNNQESFDPDEWKQINIEEVFTFLDIGAQMYNRETDYHRAFKNCRESLETFVTSLLAVKSEGFHCEHLMEIVSELSPEDSIISFNWDTIADFTLQRLNCPQFAGYVDLMAQRPRIANFLDRGVLMKLHGSLNWMVCPNPECSLHNDIRLAVREGRLERFSGSGKCPECGNEHGEPFIIPPTSRKLIKRGTMMHRLWMLAREQLTLCGRIVFIGYSFPATDFYSEWLFRQIYFTQEGRPEIIVVNPEVMDRESPLSKRYDKLFRGCTMHRFESLGKFRRKGIDLLRPRNNNTGRRSA